MRKRTLALLIAGTFLFGTAAACSDDDPADGGSGGDTEETTGGDDGGDASGNADVQAYCDAVDAYVDAGAFDATKAQELGEQATELGANAADLTAEDSQAISDCTARLAELVPG